MRFFNHPRFVERAAYDRVVETVATTLRRQPGLVAVYQLGGVGAPGISDVDMLAVFEDGSRCDANVLDALDATGRYLFTHGVFAISRGLVADAVRYGGYDGFRLVTGEDVLGAAPAPLEESAAVRRQIALEFLLMNYIARVVDSRYGIASLRNVLLSTHALRFDLDLLGVTGGAVRAHLATVADWRGRWFTEPVADAEVDAWWRAFVPALGELLAHELGTAPLALPAQRPIRIARHIVLHGDRTLRVTHRGIRLPARWMTGSRRHVRVHNRLNRFRVGVPAKPVTPGSVLDRRYQLLREVRAEAQSRFPQFTALLNNFTLKVA